MRLSHLNRLGWKPSPPARRAGAEAPKHAFNTFSFCEEPAMRLTPSAITTLACSSLIFSLFAATPADAQPAPFNQYDVPVRVNSGLVQSTDRQPTVVFSDVITVPGADWMRLKFDTVKLAGEVGTGRESYLVITSTRDGAFQYLNAEHVRQWQHTSAYFNGDTVTIELVACPNTGWNELSLSKVAVGTPGAHTRTICGPTDDRVPSGEPRAGRMAPAGCTAWIIDDCSHCLLTAGHCSGLNSAVEFNVPLSDPNGNVQHPSPDHQYAIDPVSMQSNGGQGMGDDWAYFGCFPNSNTGLTPYEAQGGFYTLALPPSVWNQNIRITGYGSVSSPIPPEWNYAQKTHVGPYQTLDGTRLGYRTDTSGGNSGSPVVIEETGLAIGIHTHGGCNSSGGENSGTGMHLPDLQTALANPLGVCAAPVGLVVTPGSDLVSAGEVGGPFTPASKDYTLESFSGAPLDYDVSADEPWVTITNGSGTLAPGGTAVVTVALNANANLLDVGPHACTVSFVNTTSHEGDTTRAVHVTVGSPQAVYTWNMDTDPGWNTQGAWAWGQPTGQGGAHGSPDPNSGYTGANVYGYNLNGDYTNNLPEYHLTTGWIDCSQITGTSLRFWRWLGVEHPDYDHATLRISTDAVQWHTVWTNTAEVTDSAWVEQVFDISSWADGNSIRLRWTMGPTDGGWTYCGWNIDDVEISGLAPGPDCNSNGVHDTIDILSGTSADCNTNAVPDECDIANGTSQDNNGNGIPDECEGVWCLGDSNCSGGAPDFLDIEYFVEALVSDVSWRDYHRTHGQMFDPPPCPYGINDMNGGGVEFTDIQALVNQLGQPCLPMN
jgi:V8-like Glu-specific endopeptidase